jgi:hypothetical protein
MAETNTAMIKKLQRAINSKGERLLINQNQWYSEKQNRPVTRYIIKKVTSAENYRTQSIELFSTCSALQTILFLRDYWYQLNDWEVPTDNEKWNEAKKLYYQKRAEE